MALMALAAASMAAVTASACAPPLTVTNSGAWCWFGDPRAVYYAGARRQTYVGWISADGTIGVTAFDHDRHTVQSSVVAPRFEIDDHDSPSLFIRRDKRVMVLWTPHGPGTSQKLYYRVSLQPEDISAWGPVRVVPGDGTPGSVVKTYPNPIELPAEQRLYLFFRGNGSQPAFETSSDEGDTWSSARRLIEVANQRPYVKYSRAASDAIDFTFTESNPNEGLSGVYFARYRGGGFYRADGSKITDLSGLPLRPSSTDQVQPPTGAGSWVQDIADDRAGRPVIVYTVFPTGDDHRYRYARWDGSRWETHEIVAAGGSIAPPPALQPFYSGGAVLDHEDPSTVYLSRAVAGVHEVEQWNTADGGTSWRREAITARSREANVRPVTPLGEPSGDLDVFWMQGRYDGFTSYQTRIMSRSRTSFRAVG